MLTIAPGKTFKQEGTLFKKRVIAKTKKDKAKQRKAQQEQIDRGLIEDRCARKVETDHSHQSTHKAR